MFTASDYNKKLEKNNYLISEQEWTLEEAIILLCNRDPDGYPKDEDLLKYVLSGNGDNLRNYLDKNVEVLKRENERKKAVNEKIDHVENQCFLKERQEYSIILREELIAQCPDVVEKYKTAKRDNKLKNKAKQTKYIKWFIDNGFILPQLFQRKIKNTKKGSELERKKIRKIAKQVKKESPTMTFPEFEKIVKIEKLPEFANIDITNVIKYAKKYTGKNTLRDCLEGIFIKGKGGRLKGSKNKKKLK